MEDDMVISAWYAQLDTERNEQVGGAKIVQFLKSSNAPKETLKAIWDIASGGRPFVNPDQFTLLIRLLSIAKSPIYMGLIPSMEKYHQTVNSSIPLPQLTFTQEGEAAAATRASGELGGPGVLMSSNLAPQEPS